MIRIRKQHRVFGRGTFQILDVGNPHVLVFNRKHENQHVICAFNFSRAMQSVRIPIGNTRKAKVTDLIGDSRLHDARARSNYQFTLGPRGYAWLQIDG